MTKFFLSLVLIFAALQAHPASEDVFETCSVKDDDVQRLSCYDRFAEAALIDATKAVANTSAKDSTEAVEKIESEDSKDALWSLEKLTSDDPNFFGYSTDPSSNSRQASDHLEFDISIKYPVWKWGDRSRLFFIYNGSYDFQALSGKEIYDSSPVISTTQNPGFAYEWDAASDAKKKYRIGVFHHSNGQTLNVSEEAIDTNSISGERTNTSSAADEFANISNEWGEAAALERVSRSSWYTQFRYQQMSHGDGAIRNSWWQYQLEIRPWYFKNDDEIFWAPIPKHQPQIENFDGLRAVGERMFTLNDIPLLGRNDAWQEFASRNLFRVIGRVELQTGLWSPFENIGGQVSLGFNAGNFILSTYYYSGFAKDISSYHKRTKHIGIGIELR